MTPFEFALLSLASWRIAYMLVHERGFLGIFSWYRDFVHVARVTYTPDPAYPGLTEERCDSDREMGKLLCCVYCTSVWVAAGLFALVALAPGAWWVVDVLAVMGGVVLIQRWFSQ